MSARGLKFHLQIPHEKIVNPFFFFFFFFLFFFFPFPSYAPFLSYVPLKTNFENLVCRISQKVFELEPSYVEYWLELRSS